MTDQHEGETWYDPTADAMRLRLHGRDLTLAQSPPRTGGIMKAQIRKDLDKFDLPRWEWRIVNEATNEVVHVSERWCGTEEQAITQARAALGHEVDGWTDIEP